ncbi:PREDICTED: uncharacterized protein LOC105559063 [Vollenhovia emeryi]|uniref:uncharacterized protein LOC105559063 n=1 Tax=Vollenhovia emeryi TaxID=411798 RepID=UPI0005F5467A|nr:PREDICTED: uncharacterized protein LOC105559063 [Vollenhovia emeryi]
MTEIEEWMWKHYTKETSDTVKCNCCEEIFSNNHRLQILKYHLYDDHEITELNEHEERDNIQQHYKITCLTAKCNHCKRESNLAINGVHNLIMHLQVMHSDKIEKKRSFIWDNFEEGNNEATCKQCGETIKINTNSKRPNLICHLRSCRFDITEDKATCKVCKRVIKINPKRSAPSLFQHLCYCSPFKNEDPDKTNLNKIKKTSHLWDKFDITGNKATCKGCKKVVTVHPNRSTTSFHQHLLYCGHFKNDKLDKHKVMPKRSNVWDKFDVRDDDATCKGCKKILAIKRGSSIANLSQHLRRCHHLNFDNLSKDELNKLRKKSKIWGNFDNNEDSAICKQCKETISITGRYPGLDLRNHLKFCRKRMKKMKKNAIHAKDVNKL